MRLTWRDGVATLLAAGVIGVYAAFEQGVDLVLVSGARSAGIAVFLLGMALCSVGAAGAFTSQSQRWATITGSMLGVAALTAAVAAVATASEAALAALVGITVALWAFTTLRHTMTRTAEPPVAEVRLEQHKDELPPRLNVG